MKSKFVSKILPIIMTIALVFTTVAIANQKVRAEEINYTFNNTNPLTLSTTNLGAFNFGIFTKSFVTVGCDHLATNIAARDVGELTLRNSSQELNELVKVGYVENSTTGLNLNIGRTTDLFVVGNTHIVDMEKKTLTNVDPNKSDSWQDATNGKVSSMKTIDETFYIDFDAAFSNIRSWSDSTSQKTYGQLESADGYYHFGDPVDETKDILVLKIPASEIQKTNYINNLNTYISALTKNGTRTVIFNVDGSGNVETSMTISLDCARACAGNVLWNFNSAISSVTVNADFSGTIIAPAATVTNNGAINGSIISSSVAQGNGEIRAFLYRGRTDIPSEPPTTEPPTTEPPTTEPPTTEPPTTEPPTTEPPTTEPPTTEPPTTEPPTTEPPTTEPPTTEPPTTEPPTTEPPTTEPPTTEPPTTEPPTTEPPTTEPPTTEPPTTEPPTTEPPTTEPPTTEPPTTEPPTTEPPTTEPPTTEPPTTEPPTTEPPTTEPPTTEPPTTEPQTTEPPTTEPQTTEPPTTPPVVITDTPVALVDGGEVLGASREQSEGEVLGASRRVHTADASRAWTTTTFLAAIALGGTLLYGKKKKNQENQ